MKLTASMRAAIASGAKCKAMKKGWGGSLMIYLIGAYFKFSSLAAEDEDRMGMMVDAQLLSNGVGVRADIEKLKDTATEGRQPLRDLTLSNSINCDEGYQMCRDSRDIISTQVQEGEGSLFRGMTSVMQRRSRLDMWLKVPVFRERVDSWWTSL
ncbi:hypothetical protein F0562_010821 [Nyssa sinensis]|uniref:Uncharacterized protein n=1 Tax=Nyssa sinensis TaxID=561372 RepID=A0A5J5A260_9ASTE|nr:hypothetical protein F0562_010821 [Nyssa sinensis]